MGVGWNWQFILNKLIDFKKYPLFETSGVLIVKFCGIFVHTSSFCSSR